MNSISTCQSEARVNNFLELHKNWFLVFEVSLLESDWKEVRTLDSTG